MKFNELPEGFKGEQKRQTEFESPEAKLTQDAINLIAIAKEQSARLGQMVDPITLARRKDNNIEALRAAIAIQSRVKAQMQTDHKEAAPEQGWLSQFKARFEARTELHPGVEWTDVEKSLQADPDAMRKLKVLDDAGFEMNVFQAKNDGEIQFRTAQTDVGKIAEQYRTIMYDKKAQEDYPQYRVNGNAVDMAASLGCELADNELYEQSRVRRGWVWLKTDPATRATGDAFLGGNAGISRDLAGDHFGDGSFCAALRVQKA